MQSKPGFTLIELIVVLVIMGIMSAIAIPRFTSNNDKLAYRAARELVVDLRYTRSMAISTSLSHYLKLYPTGGPYTEYKIFDADDDQKGETRTISDEVTCTASTDTFTFNYLGSSDSASIQIDDGTENPVVNISILTGRATIE